MLIESVGACKRALETLQPTIRNTANPQEFPPDLYKLMVAEGLKAQCVIPLVSRGRVVGALTINRSTDDPFLPDEIDFLKEASGQIAIAIENCVAFSEISELKEKLAQEKLYLEEEIRGDMNFEQIVGNSPALKRVLELVETVAPSDSTVLLLGETGTGKELIARAIHDRSRRKDRTFVKVNCAAIPTGLLESELFGHEKGAFTGAITQKIGRLELADQGTLFLDEVGDIPTEIQPKLLRALQEREFERLGSTHTRKVNVRLVAATNRDLEKMIAAREFRSDLYYRLNVFPIRHPAAARTQRGHFSAGELFRSEVRETNAEEHSQHTRSRNESINSLRMARECSGSGKLHRARGDPYAGQVAHGASSRTAQGND